MLIDAQDPVIKLLLNLLFFAVTGLVGWVLAHLTIRNERDKETIKAQSILNEEFQKTQVRIEVVEKEHDNTRAQLMDEQKQRHDEDMRHAEERGKLTEQVHQMQLRIDRGQTTAEASAKETARTINALKASVKSQRAELSKITLERDLMETRLALKETELMEVKALLSKTQDKCDGLETKVLELKAQIETMGVTIVEMSKQWSARDTAPETEAILANVGEIG